MNTSLTFRCGEQIDQREAGVGILRKYWKSFAPKDVCEWSQRISASGGYIVAAYVGDVQRRTSADPEGWSPHNRPWGQCAVTALVVQDRFGGELLRARVDGVSHYWNRLPDGSELDLTRERVRQLEGQALARLAALRDMISIAA